MTSQTHKPQTQSQLVRDMFHRTQRNNIKQSPRQLTQDLFERLSRKQRIVTVVALCGDTLEGRIVWVDLRGFEFKDLGNVNYYFPHRNIQTISWV